MKFRQPEMYHIIATPVCTVASRHYTQRPELYPLLLDAAKGAAGAALNGPKNVETCQAYFILGVYGPPSKSFREDRGFLYFGLAIRYVVPPNLYILYCLTRILNGIIFGSSESPPILKFISLRQTPTWRAHLLASQPIQDISHISLLPRKMNASSFLARASGSTACASTARSRRSWGSLLRS